MPPEQNTDFRDDLIRSLAKFETTQAAVLSRLDGIESKLEDKYVRKDAHHRLETAVSEIERTQRTVVFAGLGAVLSFLVAFVTKTIKIGGSGV